MLSATFSSNAIQNLCRAFGLCIHRLRGSWHAVNVLVDCLNLLCLHGSRRGAMMRRGIETIRMQNGRSRAVVLELFVKASCVLRNG